MDKETAGKIWNDICHHINRHKNETEEEFQKIIEILLGRLDWLFDEIISKEKTQIGANNSIIPDIIIKNNDERIIVIEVKKNIPNLPKEAEPQLHSYMMALNIKFGIIIWEKLRFYYGTKNPIMVFETDFNQDNEEAIEFISLICKPFEENKIIEFCEGKILKKEDRERFEKLKDEIINGAYDSEIKDLFIGLLQQKYDKQIVDKISNEFEVKISQKNPSAGNNKINPKSVTPNEVIKHIKSLFGDKNISVNREPENFFGIRKNNGTNFIAVLKNGKIVTLLLKLDLKIQVGEKEFIENISGKGNAAGFKKCLRVKIKDGDVLEKAEKWIKRAYEEN